MRRGKRLSSFADVIATSGAGPQLIPYGGHGPIANRSQVANGAHLPTFRKNDTLRVPSTGHP
jgi:hypothetical protein